MPPGPVTNLSAQSNSPTSVTLNWTNPVAADFLGVRICRNIGTVAPTYPCGGATVSKPTATYLDTAGLLAGTQYTYSLFAFDQSLNIATGAHTTVTTQSVPNPPPANVTGLTATPLSATSIKLDWTNPADADFAGVRICRNFGTVVATLPCAGVNVLKPLTTFTDSNSLIPGTQYTYTVFAFDTAANAASGAHATATTQAAVNGPPANVTGLTATPLSSTSIKLDWTNPADADLAGVYICRNQGPTAPTYPCGGVSVAGTTFTDNGLLPNTQYTYSVFAFDTAVHVASGASATATTQASVNAPPANVTNLTATALGQTSVQLNWTNPADADLAGVYICRLFGTAVATLPCGGVTVPAGTTTFTDTTALPGTEYTYTVFAFDTAVNAASGVSATETTDSP